MVWKEGDMTFPRSAKKYNVEEIAQCNKNDVIWVIVVKQRPSKHAIGQVLAYAHFFF